MLAPPKPPPQDELEALIKEARARQVRRRLLAAVGVAIAAGLALGIHAVVTGGAHGASIASAGSPGATTAPCTAAGGWRLRLGSRWSEPTEQETAPLQVIRLGAQSCTLRGYPQVALVGAKGRTLGFHYTHRGDLVVAARSPRAVHVASGGSAFFLLNKNTCDFRQRYLARWLWVTLPGVRGRLTLRLPRYAMLGYCPARLPPGETAPGMTIAVSPLVERLTQVTARLP